jgi:N-acetylglucosaminyldiphosphoundecaprenol N-acetyl-beta-D-mannosaminyltransferase
MQASVKIMNMDVDMMSNDVFIRKMNEYLTDDRLDVILFASTGMMNLAVEDEEYRSLLECADLFLPGERALLTNHHVDVLEAGGMVVNYESFGMMLENLIKEDRTLYVIADSQEAVEKLQDYCQEKRPQLRLVGSCAYDATMEDAAVVNEINSHTPDMILLNLPVGVQERWIAEHSTLLNARICIAIGGVAGLMLAGQRETPGWVRRLHLEGFYQRIVREQAVKKDVKERIFRKKLTKYNSQNEIHDYTQDDGR